MEENEKNNQIDIQIQDKWFEKGFTQIPNCVLKDTDITYQARILYAILLSYAWQKESCNPTQEKIANDLGVSVRTIRTLLNELRDKGLISWKKVSMGGHNTYLIRSLAERYTESDGDSDFRTMTEVHFRTMRKYTSGIGGSTLPLKNIHIIILILIIIIYIYTLIRKNMENFRM